MAQSNTNTNAANEYAYIYLGDRHTDATLRQRFCRAVRRADGKCIRGKNGAMLVRFESGATAVVIGRLLRKKTPLKQGAPERS